MFWYLNLSISQFSPPLEHDNYYNWRWWKPSLKVTLTVQKVLFMQAPPVRGFMIVNKQKSRPEREERYTFRNVPSISFSLSPNLVEHANYPKRSACLGLPGGSEGKTITGCKVIAFSIKPSTRTPVVCQPVAMIMNLFTSVTSRCNACK